MSSAAADKPKAPSGAHGHGHSLPFHKQVVAGAAAGLAEVLVMYPLDVVKTRSQLSTARSASVFGTLATIVREEGVFNLYRGIVSPILAEAPKRAVKFATNERYKDMLKLPNGDLPSSRAAIAGALAGGTETFFNCPFEVIKVRMQAKTNLGRYKNSFDALLQLIRHEGALALYKGFEPQLWRNCVWNGAYFGIIGAVRNKFAGTGNMTSSEKAWRNFSSGVVAGGIATTLNTPFDVVKSRMQNQVPGEVVKYRNAVGSLVTIAREEGLVALYKGYAARMIRLGPGGGIMLVAFDLVASWLQ